MTPFIRLAALLLLLAACDDHRPAAKPPAPHDFTADTVAHFCSMSLGEHPGPKGQILLTDRAEPIWFASVRDTFAASMLPEEPKNIAAIYVTDLGAAADWAHPAPGNWIEAHDAWFVVGSDAKGGMGGGEFLPFGRPEDARRYAASHGGTVKRFAEILEPDVFAPAGTSETP